MLDLDSSVSWMDLLIKGDKVQTMETKINLQELYQMNYLFFYPKPSKLDKNSKYSGKKTLFSKKYSAIRSEKVPEAEFHIST